MGEISRFERLGGEGPVRSIMEDFVDRLFSDIMIGFHFRGADRDRIKAMEYLHAARHLGADVVYTGKPMRSAHAPHRILGGHFLRRIKVLDDVLRAHGVPDDIREAWVAHNVALRPLVTADAGSACDATLAEAFAQEALSEARKVGIEAPDRFSP